MVLLLLVSSILSQKERDDDDNDSHGRENVGQHNQNQHPLNSLVNLISHIGLRQKPWI